jgi:uncharacterized membrane protein
MNHEGKNMTMEKLGIKHLGLMLIGIILLVIGLTASFYCVEPWFAGLPDFVYPYPYYFVYPYQTIGIILTVSGLVLAALGVSTHQERQSRQDIMRELIEKL